MVEAAITDDARKTLELLLANESTLSELAALKQDAKSFRYRQMGLERQKRLTLKLRQSGQFLYRLRLTAVQARQNQPVSTVLRMATLPPAHRQRGGSLWLPNPPAGR